MDYFLFRRISSGQPIQELALTVDANQIVGSDGTGLLKTFTIGGANGILQLDAGGKVPLSALPDKAIQTVQTVANQAARFALTSAQVQVGDLVKQTDDSSYHELVDEANVGNANGWLKRNLTDEIEELNFTLANGAAQSVTIVKKLTIINVEPPVNPVHSCTLLVIGGSGGEVVYVQRPQFRGSAGVGSVQVRTYSGSGTTSQVAIATLNSTSSGHQTLILQRSFGTVPSSIPLFRPVLRTSGNQIQNVSASGATSGFYKPDFVAIKANGTLAGSAKLQNLFGTAFGDGDTVSLVIYDFSNTPIASMNFEFDNTGMLNDSGAVMVSIPEYPTIWDCYSALLTAMAGYGFSGSFESGTNEEGFPFIKFTGDSSTYLVAFGSTNPYAGATVDTLNGEMPTGAGDLISASSARILAVHVQHGPNGGIDQAITARLFDGNTVTKQLFTIPAGGASNVALTLGEIAWEPGALEWMIFNAHNQSALITFTQENPATNSGITHLAVQFASFGAIGCSVSQL